MNQSKNTKRVVVTGLGAITPIGNDVSSFWESLLNGVSGAGPITRFDATNFKTGFACEVKDFEAGSFLSHKETRIYDLYTQVGLRAAGEALNDSGLHLSGSFEPTRAGVIWGSGNGGFQSY